LKVKFLKYLIFVLVIVLLYVYTLLFSNITISENVEEKGLSVAVDSNGNAYVAGVFSGTADFDPGSGVDEHTATNFSLDTFLSAFDSSGGFSWAYTGHDKPYVYNENKYVAVDNNGNVYISGSFEGTIDFDPGTNVSEYTASYNGGVYLCKYDPEGNFQWARAWGSETAGQMTFDSSGNLFIISMLRSYDPIDFDPGSGVDEHSGSGVYLSKFDLDGNFIWAKVFQGSQLVIDNSGNFYTSGLFTGSTDFDPGPGEEILNGFNSLFLCKLAPDVSFMWVHTFRGINNGLRTSIAIDSNSNILVVGTIYTDAFLYKYDSNGDSLWEYTFGGSGQDSCNCVTVDANDNIYIAGYFESTVDFDPGPSTNEHLSSRGFDAYLSKFDSSGKYLWTRTWGGRGWDKANGIAFDSNGYIYVTGEFCSSVDFDTGPGTDLHDSNSYNDIFLSKFDLDGNYIWSRTWGGDNPLMNW
jgi:hypothetical protein